MTELTLNPSQQISKLIRVAAIASAAAVISSVVGVVGIYSALTKKPQVVAITDGGRIIPLVPLDKPYVSVSRVLAFSEECTRKAFSHDFVEYRASISRASECFTNTGAKMFTVAMEPMLKELVSRRMVMSASVEAPVLVQGPYEKNGRAAWRVQAKMQLSREGSSQRMSPQLFVVEMEVVRVELEESTRGIAIQEFNVKPTSI